MTSTPLRLRTAGQQTSYLRAAERSEDCASGAGLPLDAPILTATGWRPNGDIAIGDALIDPRGGQSRVIRLHPGGIKEVYQVSLQDGSRASACADHKWEIQTRDSNNRKKLEIVSTMEMKARTDKKHWQVLLPKTSPFTYHTTGELPIHPYLMGILLAEGSLSDQSLTFGSGDTEIVDRISTLLPSELTIKSSGIKHRISAGNWGGAQTSRNTTGRNVIITSLRGLGLWGTRSHTKFIPEIYLRSEVKDRAELLRGLMDGDGSIKTDGNIRYATVSEQLAYGIRELIWSLEGRAKIVLRENRTYKYKGEARRAKNTYWINGICGITLNPFWLERKAKWFAYSAKSDSYSRKVRGVNPIGAQLVQGIEVCAASNLIATHDNVVSRHTQTGITISKLPAGQTMLF
ncbi:LAGLIDADG family homing endonuclease [Streptomyces sp. NPDC050400]|uniref:LAGLIDADG family homing endonuclease n=1 Tax=Streptomyces sp. NPDC050400 TaxID=3365610 RepID=UPI0037A055F0